MAKRSVKHHLVLSAISLLLCISMLIGSTFAWFTDSVTSTNNIIQSGTLDVELEYSTDMSNWTTVDAETNIFKKDALWEPGYTEVVYLRVSNVGTLDIKYDFGINVESETAGTLADGSSFKLSDYIYFDTIEDVATAYAGRDAARKAVDDALPIKSGYTKSGTLLADTKESKTIALVVYMPETIANEANYRGTQPVINLGLNLFATQLTSEYDSFGNDYDSMADGYYHVYYGFNDADDLLSFAPVAGDAASSGLSIKDGKAQIDNKGASYTFDADLGKHEYIVEYDMDITDVAIGQNVTVDAGNAITWSSTPIVLERGSTKVYYGTWKNEFVGELEGTVLHITHIFKLNSDDMLEITTTVSDGEESVTYAKTFNSEAQAKIYWDIFYATDPGKATMDNFSVKAVDAVVDSASKLSSALEEGGKVVLTADVSNFDGAEIANDTVIDLNGYAVAGDNGITVADGASLSISNGTFDISCDDSSAISLTNTEEGTTSTLNLEDVVINFTDVDDPNYNAITVDAEAGKAVLNINDGTQLNVVADHQTPILIGDNAEVNVNGGEINVENTLKNAACVWGMYVDSPSAVINVNGGLFNIRGVHSASGIYAYDYPTTVNIRGGVFNVETSGGYGIGVEVYKGTVNATGGVFSIKATGGTAAYAFEETAALDLNVSDGVIINVFEGNVNKAFESGNQNPDGCNAVINFVSEVSGYDNLYTDGTNYYVYDAQGLISMRDFWKANWCGNNMWGRSYNVMNDIDATGFTWENVWVNVGNNDNAGFVFDGHGNTITGLTIKDGLFSGTPNGGNRSDAPGYMKDITFDGVKVVGDHFVGVLWSNVYSNLVVENVSVINSEIIGKCNVAALVGATVIDGGDGASVTFKNCVVKNNVITAEGKDGQDPNGANVYISRAYGNTSVEFVNCVSEGNTVTNNNGLVGGGIYGYTIWANGGFTGTDTCDSFTAWNGLSVPSENTVSALKDAVANGGTVALDGVVDLDGTNGTYLSLNDDVTVKGGTISGTGWTGELNYAVNATDGNIVFDGVTFDTTEFTTVGTANWGISANVNGSANVIFKNCVFKGTQCSIYQSGSDTVIVLDNCKFDTTSVAIQCEIYSGDFSLGQDLIVKNCDFGSTADVLHIYDYDKNPSSQDIVDYLNANGNTFSGVCKQTCK